MLSGTLIIDKEEQSVSQERAAKGSTEHRPVQRRNCTKIRAVRMVLVCPAVGVEIGVLQEHEGVAVKIVCAALGDHYDLAAIGVAVFGSGIAGDYANLS